MSHLPEETVAAYVDGGLTSGERREADRHLARCTECRSDIREVRRALKSDGGGRWARPAVVGSALAAAAIAALLLLPNGDPINAPGSGSGLQDSPFRSAPVTDHVPVEIEPLSPRWANGASSVTLLWRPVSGASTYRVTLTDAAGAKLWSGETADSVAAVPSEVALKTAETYFWFVDATLADGTAASTGVQTLPAR